MRSIILASALLVVALAVILAVSASHKKDAAGAASQTAKTTPVQQPQQQQPAPSDGVRRVTVDELRAALEKGTAIVVDVRGEDQYKAGHIKGALWIPGDQLAGRTKELPKDKLIVTYCS
jgi:3-mercaptopyruvate sulfurtransferase SseA